MKRSLATISGADPDLQDAPRTVAEAIYRTLRSDILWGRLPPEQALRSDELRAKYKVGISPLREALSRLAAQHLVTTVGQRGFRVAPLTVDDVKDTLETRLIIERAALAASIKKGDIAWETALVGSFHSLSRTPMPKGPGQEAEIWSKHHRQFHLALLAACQSRWQLEMAGLLFDQAERHRVLRVLRSASLPQLARDTTAEHKEILDAALARNVKAAMAALETHYRTTAERVIATLEHVSDLILEKKSKAS
jgi:GntR family transcriptional regulator, carbon starvation induced regulator